MPPKILAKCSRGFAFGKGNGACRGSAFGKGTERSAFNLLGNVPCIVIMRAERTAVAPRALHAACRADFSEKGRRKERHQCARGRAPITSSCVKSDCFDVPKPPDSIKGRAGRPFYLCWFWGADTRPHFTRFASEDFRLAGMDADILSSLNAFQGFYHINSFQAIIHGHIDHDGERQGQQGPYCKAYWRNCSAEHDHIHLNRFYDILM